METIRARGIRGIQCCEGFPIDNILVRDNMLRSFEYELNRLVEDVRAELNKRLEPTEADGANWVIDQIGL